MKEIRICEIRADAAAGAEQALRLEGRPIVYDQPTKINDPAGAFIEVIRAGALENADLSDARLLYNHDLNKVPLARTPKTMQLIHDRAGLRMVARFTRHAGSKQRIYGSKARRPFGNVFCI